MVEKKDFNQVLKEKLRTKRVSVPKMASTLNIPQTRLKNWINRNKYPRNLFETICIYLGIKGGVKEAQENYNFEYLNDFRSNIRLGGRDFETFEGAKEYTTDMLYRTALNILSKLYLSQPIDKREIIVGDLEQLIKKYNPSNNQ